MLSVEFDLHGSFVPMRPSNALPAFLCASRSLLGVFFCLFRQLVDPDTHSNFAPFQRVFMLSADVSQPIRSPHGSLTVSHVRH